MTFVPADWSITRATGNIRYIGDAHTGATPSYATVIELHRALGAFAASETSTGDDELAIIDQTPSDRGGVDTNITLLNGYNIDKVASEHLYDGSITQDDGDEIFDGIQVVGNSVSIQVIQNGAVVANDFWNEPKMIAATSDAISNTSHRFLLPVRTSGADIDGRRLFGTQRVYGTRFTEFFIGSGTARGNSVLALTANPDNGNQTPAATIAGYSDIVITEGFADIDVNSDGTDENYYTNIAVGTRSKNDVYERGKYIQREGTTEMIFGLPGDVFRGVTHQWEYDGLSGTFATAETVSWTGGTAQILADNGTDTMWVQLLTGQAPVGNTSLTGGTSAATANVDGTVTQRTVPSTFIGDSTGAAILGAFGVGIRAADLTNADRLIDLTNVVRTPPNNVQFRVEELVVGEDFVLVTANDNGNIDFDQLSVSSLLNGAAVTSIQMTAAIPTDTPLAGKIFVQRNSGNYTPIEYTSYTGSTFTVVPTDFSSDNAAANNNAFIAYISELATSTMASFTVVYLQDRSLFIRIRDAGTAGDMIPTKTFETIQVLGSSGSSVRNNRRAD